MTHTHKLILWLLVLGSVATGLGQAWMRYLVEPKDEFSAWNHPWQGTTESLHVFLAPMLTLVLGFTLAAHAAPKLASPITAPKRRRSGTTIIVLILVLVLTAAWMTAWTKPELPIVPWIHGIAGSLFAIAFLGHALRR